MSERHPEPETLVAFVEGSLPAGESEVIARHVHECARCRGAAGSLQGLDRLVSKATRPTESQEESKGLEMSAGLDAALEAVLDQHVRAKRQAEAVRRAPVLRLRFAAWLGAAAAASLLLFFSLRTESAKAPFEVRLVLTPPKDAVRSASPTTYHFDVDVHADSLLGIVRVERDVVEVIYPHPNPELGTYGHQGAFSSGTKVRIPKAAIADEELPPSGERPVFFVFRMKEARSGAALRDEILPLISKSGEGDLSHRTQAVLAQRFSDLRRL